MTFGDGPVDNAASRIDTASISQQESKRILGATEIHGGEYKGFTLTPETLTQHGLAPKYKFEIQERDFVFSQPFLSDPEGHLAFIAYVQEGDTYVTRTFYRSNSQAMWRENPYFYINRKGEVMYGKGYEEQSLNLATPLQEILEDLIQSEDIIPNFPEAEAISLTTAPNIDSNGEKYRYLYYASKSQDAPSKEDYAREARASSPHLDYEDQVNPAPTTLFGNFYVPNPNKQLPDPTTLRFERTEDEPNFSKKISTRNTDSSTYGKITLDVFPSGNGKFIYTFCRDDLKRAWIGRVEVEGEIQSTGLRKQWVDAGVLTIPAYEYDDQEGGYGNEDLRKGEYVDMYKNFHSKIPIIEAYQATVT